VYLICYVISTCGWGKSLLLCHKLSCLPLPHPKFMTDNECCRIKGGVQFLTGLFFHFFFSWEVNTQLNHYSKKVMNTQRPMRLFRTVAHLLVMADRRRTRQWSLEVLKKFFLAWFMRLHAQSPGCHCGGWGGKGAPNFFLSFLGGEHKT